MFRGIRAKFLAFRAGERGVVLFLVALLMVPFVALLGVAVDVGELLLVKNQLAAAIDAAALDIGATPGLTQAQANAQAQAFVNANFAAQYPSATVSSLNVTLSQTQASGGCPANTVCITASASVNTAFVRILGSQFNTLSAGVSTQVTTAQNYLEVVLVLDNTGSMASMYGSMPGIQGERLAATTLVNTLFASDPTQQYVKIGIVPFTANVKLPQEFVSNLPWWIDNAQHNNTAGPMSQENLGLPTNKGLVDFANQLATATNNSSWAWSGCVRQRTEMVNGVRVDYDVKDVAPTSSIPETLFTPFFAPDEPDAAHRNGKDNCNGQSSFFNSYLCDGSTTCWQGTSQAEEQTDQLCIAKYTTNPVAEGSGAGPNAMCTIQPIMPLSNDQAGIIAEINLMQAYGNTVIPAGLEWGWHLISPTVSPALFPNSRAVSYSDTKTIKAIILVTDGRNDVSGGNNFFNQSVYNAYGYGNRPHLNLLSVPSGVNQPQPEYNLDQKLINLCNNIKAVTDANGNTNRILLYMIGFGSTIDDHGLQLLQQCATNSSTYFYNPTSDELVTTFQSIAVGLSQLRISK